MSPSQLVWLITGTSTGFGRELALAALRRGDKVIATARARSLSQIDDLKEKGAAALQLDVTASLEDLQAVAKKAVRIYGQIDVVVNNAGYVLVGAIEENTPEESFDQFNTNVFGAINVTRAFLPYMRERKAGTIIFLGSLGGWRSCPAVGLYAATKWALRGISATLHDEIAPLGLRSICADPGYFRTSFLDPSHRKPYSPRIQDYNEVTGEYEAALQAYNNKQPGDPLKAAEVMVDVVRGEGVAEGKTFSNNIQLGSDCYEVAKAECEKALSRLEEWKDVSLSTDFPRGT
ncbi:serine 3-dehydrogenase [Moniliophthora roreri MCA 2997]|uniref:Serine 3-dehydrogenase n=1 Tax=Moniliophthora roreri (strain MCA 2997) TaxID=1381753 RepID=V2XPJ4_MONRO|nr:serine 3-dehydrogenase [Moniliophthora roreri MCA 2997]